MAPPQYSDLGKNAKDVFTKGYHFGLFKLDVKTKTASGVELSCGGVSKMQTQNVFGTLETKYKIQDYGVTLLEKWNTDNTLSTEISIQDQLAKGLKLSFNSSFASHTGQKSGHIKGSYANDICALSADMDVKLSGPVMKASSVFEYNGWLVGYQTKFDFRKSKLTQNDFAVGYSTGDFILHSSLSGGSEFAGSVYQKVNSKLETGIQIAWSPGSNETQCGLGCKYNLDKDSCVRVKVNNNSKIGLGYQQKLRDGVFLYLSTLIDSKNFNQGGHKLGIALELEA